MHDCKDVSIAQAAALLREKDDILILCHQKPDGDTLGCGFALLYALRDMGKNARVSCSDGFSARYDFLYFGEEFNDQPPMEPKYVVAVDIADTQLLGAENQHWAEKIDLCIDHHPSNKRYAKHLLLDSKAAATVEILYPVLCELGLPLTKEIATCLYTGLSTDTGCFRYSNVSATTHLQAAKMIEAGVDFYPINERMFETRSLARMELERIAIDTMEYHYGNRFAMITILQEMVEKTGVSDEELDGIAAMPRRIEGVVVAVSVRQRDKDVYRVSMRTNIGVDASKVCAEMGGGGHARAAGCTLEGDLAAVKQRIVEALQPAFEELDTPKGITS